jgi:hypothetical protein
MLKTIRRIKYEKQPIGSTYLISGEPFLAFAMSNRYVYLINNNNIVIKFFLWDWFDVNRKRIIEDEFDWNEDKKTITQEIYLGLKTRKPRLKKALLFQHHIETMRKYISKPTGNCPYDSVINAKENLPALSIRDVCDICHSFIGFKPANKLGDSCPCNVLTKDVALKLTIDAIGRYDEHKRNLRITSKKADKSSRRINKRT